MQTNARESSKWMQDEVILIGQTQSPYSIPNEPSVVASTTSNEPAFSSGNRSGEDMNTGSTAAVLNIE